jgi:hypothetical protein
MLVASACGQPTSHAIDAATDTPAVDSIAIDAPPACPAPTIIDTFDDGSAGPLFTSFADTGLTVSESAGSVQVVFAASVTPDKYAGYYGTANYDLTNRCVTMHVTDSPSAGAALYFKLTTSIGEGYEFFGPGTDNILQIRTKNGATVLVHDSVPFSLASFAYLRFRVGTDSVRWEVSPDGTAFTELFVQNQSAGINSTRVDFGAGTFTQVDGSSPAMFDRIAW